MSHILLLLESLVIFFYILVVYLGNSKNRKLNFEVRKGQVNVDGSDILL